MEPGGEPILSSQFNTETDLTSHIEQVAATAEESVSLSGPSTSSSLRTQHAPQSTSYVKIETKSTNQNCKARCPCHCHVPLKGSTPTWLRGMIGTTFFNLTSVPPLNRRSCNFNHCGQKDGSTGVIRFQYYFPSWLLPLGIAFTASCSSLNGASGTWTLRIPRTFTDGDCLLQLYKILRRGTVSDFCKAMDHDGMKSHDLILSN